MLSKTTLEILALEISYSIHVYYHRCQSTLHPTEARYTLAHTQSDICAMDMIGWSLKLQCNQMCA
jgi:hypothetical protein